MSIGEDALLKLWSSAQIQPRLHPARLLYGPARTNFLVNEALVRKMANCAALGVLQINLEQGAPARAGDLGVAEDFNFQSLHKLVNPLMVTPLSNDISAVLISATSSSLKRLLVVKTSGEDLAAPRSATSAT